jgi:DNA-binding NtrC family response regulator
MLHRMAHCQSPESSLGLPSDTVLVVDEDLGDLDYYSSLLEADGYKVLRSNCHERSIHLVAQCDFVLVSQGGPTFKCRCVLERARDMRVKTPVLVLARSKSMRCYLEAMQLGAVDYLEKPVAPRTLRELVRKYIHPPARQPLDGDGSVRSHRGGGNEGKLC